MPFRTAKQIERGRHCATLSISAHNAEDSAVRSNVGPLLLDSQLRTCVCNEGKKGFGVNEGVLDRLLT
jgi:hypothetical protein